MPACARYTVTLNRPVVDAESPEGRGIDEQQIQQAYFQCDSRHICIRAICIPYDKDNENSGIPASQSQIPAKHKPIRTGGGSR